LQLKDSKKGDKVPDTKPHPCIIQVVLSLQLFSIMLYDLIQSQKETKMAFTLLVGF